MNLNYISYKIIVMTGSVDAIDAVKARCDYAVKTQDFSLLLEAVKNLLDFDIPTSFRPIKFHKKIKNGSQSY